MVIVLDIEFIYVLARCFKFENSIDLAWHNNLYRTYCLASSTLENEVSTIVWVRQVVSVTLTAE